MELTNKLIKIQRKVNLIKEIVDGLHYVLSKKNDKYIRELNDMFKKKYYQMGGVGIDTENDMTTILTGEDFINLYDDITFKTFIDDIIYIGNKYDKETNKDSKDRLFNELNNKLSYYKITLYEHTYTNTKLLINEIIKKREIYVDFINRLIKQNNNNNTLDNIKKNITNLDIENYLMIKFIKEIYEKNKKYDERYNKFIENIYYILNPEKRPKPQSSSQLLNKIDYDKFNQHLKEDEEKMKEYEKKKLLNKSDYDKIDQYLKEDKEKKKEYKEELINEKNITDIQNNIISTNKSLEKFDKNEVKFKDAIKELKEYTDKYNKVLTEIKEKIANIKENKIK